MNNAALIEVLKSFVRFIYFGVLGLIVTFLTSLVAGGSLSNTQITVLGQSFKIGFVLVAGAALLAKAIDRYIHKNPNIQAKGISPL